MPNTSPLHAITWLFWALAAAVTLQLATSPVYAILLIGVCLAVFEAHRSDSSLARALPILVGIGIAFASLRVVLTALTTHTGIPGTTWFSVPSFTLPRLLGGFTVGGTIEGPVVLDAAAQGLVIVGIMTIFGVFNAVASHHELLQASPRAFHEPGLVVTVALAFVPSTMLAVSSAREADQARTGGRVVRRGRMVRLTIPIVESGLERAMALAESMDARGFARLEPSSGESIGAALGLVAMLSLGGALLALIGQHPAIGLGATSLGVVALVAAVLVTSGASRTTRYRPRPLRRLDLAVMGTCLLAPIGMAALGAAGNGTLHWSADPLTVPQFSLAPALCIALIAVPLAVRAHPLVDDVAGAVPLGAADIRVETPPPAPTSAPEPEPTR